MVHEVTESDRTERQSTAHSTWTELPFELWDVYASLISMNNYLVIKSNLLQTQKFSLLKRKQLHTNTVCINLAGYYSRPMNIWSRKGEVLPTKHIPSLFLCVPVTLSLVKWEDVGWESCSLLDYSSPVFSLQKLKVNNRVLDNHRNGEYLDTQLSTLAPRTTGFPSGSDGKESAWNAGDLGSVSGSGRSPPVFLPGESHWHWSLEAYSMWGCKESKTTER